MITQVLLSYYYHELNTTIAIPYFADIHCYPSMKPFCQVPEASIFDAIEAKEECKKLNLLPNHSQTNMKKCQEGYWQSYPKGP